MVVTHPKDLDVLDLDGIAALSPPILCKLGATTPELLPKDMPLNETLRDRAKLATWAGTEQPSHSTCPHSLRMASDSVAAWMGRATMRP